MVYLCDILEDIRQDSQKPVNAEREHDPETKKGRRTCKIVSQSETGSEPAATVDSRASRRDGTVVSSYQIMSFEVALEERLYDGSLEGK
jgi:hypothetical protein